MLGDPVQLAMQIESVTKGWRAKIIISEITRSDLSKPTRLRKLNLIHVKGVQSPITIYEAKEPHNDSIFPRMTETLEAFASGLTEYRATSRRKSISSAAVTSWPRRRRRIGTASGLRPRSKPPHRGERSALDGDRVDLDRELGLVERSDYDTGRRRVTIVVAEGLTSDFPHPEEVTWIGDDRRCLNHIGEHRARQRENGGDIGGDLARFRPDVAETYDVPFGMARDLAQDEHHAAKTLLCGSGKASSHSQPGSRVKSLLLIVTSECVTVLSTPESVYQPRRALIAKSPGLSSNRSVWRGQAQSSVKRGFA